MIGHGQIHIHTFFHENQVAPVLPGENPSRLLEGPSGLSAAYNRQLSQG